MKLNKETIKIELDKICNDWKLCGHAMLIKDGEILHRNHYGYSNMSKKIETKKDTKYLLDVHDIKFASLAILLAVDQGLMDLKDKVSDYIPEYKYADKMTIDNLLRSKTGMVDFYHNKIMVDLENSKEHQALSEYDKQRVEHNAYYHNRSFETVLKLIGEEDLEREPGGETYYSRTHETFMVEILKRVLKVDLFDYLMDNLFTVLGMDGVTKEYSKDVISYTEYRRVELIDHPLVLDDEYIFAVTADDMLTFTLALSDKKIFSKKLWKKVLKYDEEGDGIIFSNANGYDCMTATFLGFSFSPYVNHKTGVAFMELSNAQQTFKFVENQWRYFRKDFRETIASLTTFPENTKMVKLNKSNYWDAMGILIHEEQQKFVLEAKASIVMGLMHKEKKVFAQMEGNLVVGLLVLNVDKKLEDFDIDIIIIDKRFQGRGYGKSMVKWAVEYLKDKGAKKLTIGVARENIGAKKIYMNAGFVPDSVYDGGMGLAMEL